MKHFKHKLLFAILAVLSFTCHTQAQVTIGSGIAPTRAALLDLKSQQSAGPVTDVGDENNITSTTGGLLLPKVKLVSTTSLQPFLEDADPEVTSEFKLRLAGLMVYNIYNNGSDLYPNYYIWDGTSWGTSGVNKSAQPMTIAAHPKAFSFYELGTETPDHLVFNVNPPKDANGGFITVTYQWYELVGSNVHLQIGESINNATGHTFAPIKVRKGTTRNAKNAGFYKFYCVASSQGATVTSNIVEVAVGCGAKNSQGEWQTFMCFNLGADNNSTIQSQKDYSIGSYTNDPITNTHVYISGEENLWGDLYQWGRIKDGHEGRQSVVGSAIVATDISNGQKCSTTDTNRPFQQIKKASTFHGKFISADASTNFNWTPAAASTADQLWRYGRFIQNDPCAHYKDDGTYQSFWHEGTNETNAGIEACSETGTGWRTPIQDEWGSLYKGGSISGSPATAMANTWKWHGGTSTPIDASRGYEILPDGHTTTLFLPASGSRGSLISQGGNLFNQGTSGNYWTVSTTGVNAYYLYFLNTFINPANNAGRAGGSAIRCIKNT